jgi:hypothetical protein
VPQSRALGSPVSFAWKLVRRPEQVSDARLSRSVVGTASDSDLVRCREVRGNGIQRFGDNESNTLRRAYCPPQNKFSAELRCFTHQRTRSDFQTAFMDCKPLLFGSSRQVFEIKPLQP